MATVQMYWNRDALVRNVVLACIGIELLLFTLDYHISYSVHGAGSGAIRRLFSTSLEDGLAGWFSILQTALVAVTLWMVYLLVRRVGTGWQRRGWLVLAAFFSYLAFDDGAQIHERLGTAYHETFTGAGSGLAARTLEWFPSYRWQIVFMPMFAAMGVFMFVFLLRQLRGWKPKLVVLFALSLLAGAVLLDFFEGLAPDHPLNPYTAIAQHWQLDYWSLRNFDVPPYEMLVHFSQSIEECTEMVAMTLLWAVFLGHLTWLASDVRIRFVGDPQPAPGTATRPGSARLPVPAGTGTTRPEHA